MNATRTVLVTGGSRGLGLGIARTLRAAGYTVIAVARKETEPLLQAMRAAGPGALHYRPFDLADLDGIGRQVRELRKEFGSLYGLVNNAASGAEGLLATMRDSEIERTVRLNTISPLILTKHVVRTMMADGAGRIVTIASIVAETGYSGLSVYGATKASLVGFTRSLSREVGRLGITVNAVAPGFVDTDMTQGMGGAQRDQIIRRSALRRLAEVDDIAEAVAYLLSDRAKNITGTVLTVDAGTTA